MAHIGIYILCGGASSRMGTCKTQVKFEGQPLLDHILHTVQTLEQKIHLVCKPHQQDTLLQYGVPIVLDATERTHPLEGVRSALNHAEEQFESIIVLPCDTPRLSQTSILRLLQHVPAVVVDDTERVHPLILHLPLSWIDRCNTHLESQGSMRDFAALAHRVTVPIHETINLNRPTDLTQPDKASS